MKINLGSHNKIIGNYINIDGLDLENVDAVCDLNIIPFQLDIKNEDKFEGVDLSRETDAIRIHDNTVDEIQMIEVLEHIGFKNTEKVLREIHRILKPGGFIHIQVPDCGKAMEYYANKQVCNCVPHKSHKGDSEGVFKAEPGCFQCGGKGVINPMRWLYSFTGAQKHKYDSHLAIFTKDLLERALEVVGFDNLEFKDDIYKLKVTATK